MGERTNRRDLIVKTAAKLFAEQGYLATSTRQIAGEVGCTDAALYYHFKDGKRALLRAVIEDQLPEMDSLIEACRRADSLQAVITTLGAGMKRRAGRLQWLIAEIPHLGDDEIAVIHDKFLATRAGVVDAVAQFTPDRDAAERLTWLILFVVFGYEQLFITFGLEAKASLVLPDLVESLAELWR